MNLYLEARAKSVSSIQALKTNVILSPQQAVDIYIVKLENNALSLQEKSTCPREVAKAYGVNVKTIRDIWVGRTWVRETMHLDKTRNAMPHTQRFPGRPKGAKDKKKRSRLPSGGGIVRKNTFAAVNGKHAEEIPKSSHIDDPFHDDWLFWSGIADC